MTTINHWIDNSQQLAELCEQLQDATELAIDTEFMRSDTFFAKLALIQLSDGEQCWLIDTPAIEQLQPLTALLNGPQLTLVFHSCGEDLEVLDQVLSVRPKKLFDSQVAAGIVNIGYSMGYARLVENMLQIELGKEDTRSDWLARPLSDRQKRYAADDVLYLFRIYKLLLELLEQQQRQSWFAEEMLDLQRVAAERREALDYYLRVKGAWRLDALSLAVLKRLCEWREQAARALDKPRSHIVKDNVLLELANNKPTHMSQLHQIDDWYSRSVKRFGEQVLQEIANVDHNDLPDELPQPLSRAVSDVMKKMRVSINELAENQAIPKELMCNKKELESILRTTVEGKCVWPVRLVDGWRGSMVIPALQLVIDSSDAL
ncbi:ribonuclease D [Porticoccaceae bacterium]|jgi:ribonuclease D|nr:ribonuclease D [Porticoccaceae bacterium]MBT6114885.1 ribonuclease D [Porticoccaceae bacterium]MDB4427735.1 ribonuclease D [Porticoccaceae bacterium]MDC0589186.1 ribonuclease D [Porticoccaceae bacterium]